MLLGWWKEGLGGAIVILSLFASLIVGDYSGAGGGYMFICASPGFLFLKRPKPHFSMWRNQNGLTRTSLLAHKTKC
jgi:hypothetical protein